MKFLRLSSFIFIALCLAVSGSAATISGRVVDPDGRAVAGAHVVVSTPLGSIAERTTDAAGMFHIPELAAGVYEVRVAASGFLADPVIATLGADDTGEMTLALRISAISESVVVSASQVDLPLSRAADTVTVITAADLEAHQVETVSDALRLVPGLSVMRSGGRGALTSLFPRGGNSNYTLVLIDGIRANAFGGAYDFAHLAIADIDRIEIVRGPQSALFGSDAIGAVVQIVTRRGGAPRLSGLAEGGGQATTREAVESSGTIGRWSWGIGGGHTRSDGYAGLASTGERVGNDDYHLSHVSGSVSYDGSRGGDFQLTGLVARDERGFPGPFGSNPIGAYTSVDRVSRGVDDKRQIGGRLIRPWSSRIRQRLEVNYTDLPSQFVSPYGKSTSGTRRIDGRIQEDIALAPSLAASAGLEAQRERGSSTFITGTTSDPIPIDRAVVGTFGELRYTAGDRFFLTGGVRAEHITRDDVPANPDGFPPRPAFPSQTVNSTNPKIAVSYVLRPSGVSRTGASTRLRASAGTGIRAPDAFEIAFTNNPNLKPERSRSVDFGVQQQLAKGRYEFSATAFFNRYDDLIVTVGKALRSASAYETDNISNARARGIETMLRGRVSRNIMVRASYTHTATAVLSVDGAARLAPPPFAVGDPLIRRPRHQGAADATYSAGRWSAFAELLMRGGMLDVEPNYGAFGGLFSSRGYTVVNVGGGVRLGRGLEAYLRVLNAADRAYEETLGYPALRRTAVVGVRVAAGR